MDAASIRSSVASSRRSPSIASHASKRTDNNHLSNHSQHGPTTVPAPGQNTPRTWSGTTEDPTAGSSPDDTLTRTWSGTTQESGGHRTEPHLGRGVATSAGVGAAQWREAIEAITQYTFQNADLLEEALESPGSGVTCVGTSHRHFNDGNRGLAHVGHSVMKLVLRDQCYLFKIPDGDAENIISKILSRQNLDRLGRTSKIERFVRPRLPVRPTKKKNILHLMKDDVQREDPSRTIHRAMCAIVGAVYYDGGLQAARRLLAELDLIIKLPG